MIEKKNKEKRENKRISIGMPAYHKIVEHFGKEVLLPSESIHLLMSSFSFFLSFFPLLLFSLGDIYSYIFEFFSIPFKFLSQDIQITHKIPVNPTIFIFFVEKKKILR